MPFDGFRFAADQSVAGETYTEPHPPGPWQRIRTALATWLRPARARAFGAPLPPTREVNQAAQVLTVARNLITDERAWVQRRYETRDGRRCAVGALRGAARLLHSPVPHSEAVSSLLAVAMSRGFTDIETMNDQSTHAALLSAFDEAILRVRPRLD
jgi:hypothetical protein